MCRRDRCSQIRCAQGWPRTAYYSLLLQSQQDNFQRLNSTYPPTPLDSRLLDAHCVFLFGHDDAGHALGVAASWLVQVGIEIYRYISAKIKSKEDDIVDETEKVILLKKKIAGATLRCSASLVFASIGAGIGATLFRPSAGQWIGKFTPS